jgi:hypothetical protein
MREILILMTPSGLNAVSMLPVDVSTGRSLGHCEIVSKRDIARRRGKMADALFSAPDVSSVICGPVPQWALYGRGE